MYLQGRNTGKADATNYFDLTYKLCKIIIISQIIIFPFSQCTCKFLKIICYSNNRMHYVIKDISTDLLKAHPEYPSCYFCRDITRINQMAPVWPRLWNSFNTAAPGDGEEDRTAPLPVPSVAVLGGPYGLHGL